MVLPRRLARMNKRFLNRVMVRFAPHAPGFAVLHHRGRRSGRRYSIPINVFVHADRYVFSLTYGPGTDWLRNVRAAGRCTLTHRGRVVALRSPRIYRDETLADLPVVPRWIVGRLGAYDLLEMRRVGRSATG